MYVRRSGSKLRRGLVDYIRNAGQHNEGAHFQLAGALGWYRFTDRRFPLDHASGGCLTVEFSLLPLQATGPYGKGERNIADFYISSYTPTSRPSFNVLSAMKCAGIRCVIGTIWAVVDGETNWIMSMCYDRGVAHRTMRRLVDLPLDKRILHAPLRT